MTFDEQYDEILRQEFVSTTEPAIAAEAPAGRSRLSRYSGATVIAVGGVACTAIGALLGGLGGSVGVSPAAVHSLDAAGFPGLPAIAGASPAAALPALAKAAAALPTEGLTVTLSHGLSSVVGSGGAVGSTVHSVAAATTTGTEGTTPATPVQTIIPPTNTGGGQPITNPPATNPNLLGSLTQTLTSVVNTLTNLGGLGGSLPAPFTNLVNALSGLGSATGSSSDPVSGVVNTVTGLLGGSSATNPLAGLLGGSTTNPLSGLLNTVTSALGAGGGSLSGGSVTPAAQTQGTTLHLGSGPANISNGSTSTGNSSTTTTSSAASTSHQLTK
jgi:hypothetical protein